MSPDKTLLASFIICTRNRPQALLACLGSIADAVRHVTRPESPAAGRVPAPDDFEVLVIENGSLPAQRLEDAAVAKASDGLARIIRRPAGNLSEARNLGMAQAAGRLLAFTDDDCLLDPEWLADALRHWRQSTRPFLIGGRVRLDDPTDLPFTVRDYPKPQLYDCSLPPGGFIQGCNFILTRETARYIGPFDPRFGAGAIFRSGEDTDYTIRAHAAGVSVAYVPDMAVRHRHGRKTRAEVERLNRDYAYGNGAILAKHVLHHRWLLRHLGWTLRSALLERLGGPVFDSAIGLSWHPVLCGQLRGTLAYLLAQLSGGAGLPS